MSLLFNHNEEAKVENGILMLINCQFRQDEDYDP